MGREWRTVLEFRGGWPFILPALIFTLIFFVLPFLAMAVVSLWQLTGVTVDRSLGLDNYIKFFATPSLWRAMVNSLEVTIIVTIFSVILAYPMAWILAMIVPPRWQRLALVLAILPFWTSYVVRSYSWLLVLSTLR